MINWKCNSCDGIYESLDIRFTKHYKLVIFENHTKSTSLDITPEQARQILGVTDYTPEQYEILAEITNRPASYFMDDLVDYYVDF